MDNIEYIGGISIEDIAYYADKEVSYIFRDHSIYSGELSTDEYFIIVISGGYISVAIHEIENRLPEVLKIMGKYNDDSVSLSELLEFLGWKLKNNVTLQEFISR